MKAVAILSLAYVAAELTSDGSKLVWRTKALCTGPSIVGTDRTRLGLVCASGVTFALKLGCSISGDGGTAIGEGQLPGTVVSTGAPSAQTLGVTLSSPAPIVYCNSSGAYLATLLTASSLIGPSVSLTTGPACPERAFLSPLQPLSSSPTPSLCLLTLLATWHNGSSAVAAAMVDSSTGAAFGAATVVCTADETSPWQLLSLPPVLLPFDWPSSAEDSAQSSSFITMLLVVQYKANSSFGIAWLDVPTTTQPTASPPSCSAAVRIVIPLALPPVAAAGEGWAAGPPTVTGGPLMPGQPCTQPLVLHIPFSTTAGSNSSTRHGSIVLFSLSVTAAPTPSESPCTPIPLATLRQQGFTLSWAYTGGATGGGGGGQWLSTRAVPLYTGPDSSAVLLGSASGSVWSLTSASGSSSASAWDTEWWVAGRGYAAGYVLSDSVTAAVSYADSFLAGFDVSTGSVLWQQSALQQEDKGPPGPVLQLVADSAGHLYVLSADGSVALLDGNCPTLREARVYLTVAVLGILLNVCVFTLACWARGALAPHIQGGKSWGAGPWGGGGRRASRPLLGPESAAEGAMQWEAWLVQTEERGTGHDTEMEGHRVQAILRSWPWWKRWLAQGHVRLKQQ